MTPTSILFAMKPTRTHFFMRESDKIPLHPILFRWIKHPYVQQYFRTNIKELEQSTQPVQNESPMTRARRFAESDVSFARVYPLVPELSEEERLELARFAAGKVSGITDSTNFARNTLDKFQLPDDKRSIILQDLDSKTNGFVSQALKSQYGEK